MWVARIGRVFPKEIIEWVVVKGFTNAAHTTTKAFLQLNWHWKEGDHNNNLYSPRIVEVLGNNFFQERPPLLL